MKIASKLMVLLLLAGISPVRAQSVELTGFADLFGEKVALLVVHQPARAAPVNFTLSEGEAQYGVKLLAVDEANHRVQIEQAGGQQYVRLCAAADLTAPVPKVEPSGQPQQGRTLTPQEQLELDQFLNTNEAVQRIKAGNPIFNAGTSAAGASGSSGTGSPGQSNAGGSASQAASDPTGSSSDYTKQYWYKQSLAIEQNRVATAEDVATGANSPLPRTPLTPAEAPASLVGKDTFFSNHIPGFVETGSVDAWDSPGN